LYSDKKAGSKYYKSPIIELSKELLPEPTSPIMHTNSPYLTFKLMSLRAITFSIVELSILSSLSFSTGASANNLLASIVNDSSTSFLLLLFFFLVIFSLIAFFTYPEFSFLVTSVSSFFSLSPQKKLPFDIVIAS
jgi:hypothetical protein